MMRKPFRQDAGDSPDSALEAAHVALRAGQVEAAREQAHAVLMRAKGAEPQREARALACLAHCDRIGSRLRRASEAARRAEQLFEELGDVRGEADALITLAHVCMLLGRNDEAVESALLAVRLCDMQAAHPLAVLAHNCLGLAYSWSGDHDRADASLDRAVAIAQRCEPAVSIYQPRLNQVWVEASRLLDERFQSGVVKSLARLEHLAQECRDLEQAGLAWHVLPGMQSMGRTIALASTALLEIWRNDRDSADRAIDAAAASLPEVTTWLHAFVRWCVAEQAWAREDWGRAESELTAMREIALSVEHEQLACRAHLLLIQLFEQQGRYPEAGREIRALRRRERRVLAEGMGSREALVSWRLDARLSERHLQQALMAARQFERWSLEDALTGIANRRHFEQALTQRLAARGATEQALAVAMIDVDQFKSVNDRFTHRVGDRVLKTVAGLLSEHVRESDLPARWAGDEFVILFGDAGQAQARFVCQRIGAAVAAFDWDSIAPGLRLTVSIGLADAREGDSAETLLHRSDESMYRLKPSATVPGAAPAR
jgi:diguanylate cyclase (GGDEF)-like protein